MLYAVRGTKYLLVPGMMASSSRSQNKSFTERGTAEPGTSQPQGGVIPESRHQDASLGEVFVRFNFLTCSIYNMGK